MITSAEGSILDFQGEAIVNPVNCYGVMGKGIALQLKIEAPSNFRDYQQACKNNLLAPGQLFIVPTDELPEPIKFIINFPTKIHWKDPSELEYIEDGLEALVCEMKAYGFHSVAIPALGCGCGGLDWEKDVYPLIVRKLTEFGEAETPDRIYCIYQPFKKDQSCNMKT